MAKAKFEPSYMCWYEREFQADMFVTRGMTWLQRHFYRALLQQAFFCSTRPYLPVEDDELWVLADAPNLEQWVENKQPVLKKFSVVQNEEGVQVYAHKRLLEDWEKLLNSYEQKSAAGRASANSRKTAAQQKPTDVELQSTGRRQTKLNQTKSNETKSNQILGWVGSEEIDRSESAEEMLAEFWASAQNGDSKAYSEEDTQQFRELMRVYPAVQIAETLAWLPKSDYWGKPGRGELADSSHFCSAYQNIRNSYEKYRGAVRARAAGEV